MSVGKTGSGIYHDYYYGILIVNLLVAFGMSAVMLTTDARIRRRLTEGPMCNTRIDCGRERLCQRECGNALITARTSCLYEEAGEEMEGQ